MPELMTGTVTFLFTDIEASTRLLQKLGARFPALLDEHSALLGKVIASHGGVVVGTEGDSFFAVFKSAEAAVWAAVESQRSIQAHNWPEDAPVKVRMGLHTGEGILGGENYTGIDVHRAARISAAAHGGQVLLSGATFALVEGKLGDITVEDLGRHHLKDLEKPEHIYQLVVPGLPSKFPAIRSLQSRPNNLPAQLTSFVGRRDEVARITRLLANTRMLTLTGPGGTGKTRLSLAAAEELLPDFPDGVFFVELAPIADPALILISIAETLGLREAKGRSAAETLRTYLDDKNMLLVLDNFEQVIAGAADVGMLLEAASQLKVLVTSREPLHLAGEQEYPVPPLELPDYQNLPPLEKLSQYEAVALFIQRASAVRPGFEVTNENAPAVAEICARLDGLPLAIELAAARMKLLSPQAILARLEGSLGLLTSARSNLPARQQTLRNAIAWSYELLEGSERELFKRLGIFRGGWTLEAAEAVCSRGASGDLDMLNALASLLDKSLVRQGEQEAAEPRFIMLETIREFAVEKLQEEEDIEQIRAMHARYFVELAEEAAAHLTGDPETVKQMEAEHDNIRTALGFALERGDAELGLKLAAAAWRFWQMQGHLREGRKWLSDLVALPAAGEPTTVRAKGVSALGSIAYWQDEAETARSSYEESLRIYRELGNMDGVAEQLYNLAYVAAVMADYGKARALFRESMQWYEKIGDPVAAAYAEYGLGLVAHLEGNLEDARQISRKTAQFFESVGERFGLANSIGGLSDAELRLGNMAEARASASRALQIYLELGDFSGVAYSFESFAELAMRAEDDLRMAVVFSGAAAALEERMGGAAPASLKPFTDFKAEAAKVLASGDIEAAWRQGRALSMEDAIALALGKASSA